MGVFEIKNKPHASARLGRGRWYRPQSLFLSRMRPIEYGPNNTTKITDVIFTEVETTLSSLHMAMMLGRAIRLQISHSAAKTGRKISKKFMTYSLVWCDFRG